MAIINCPNCGEKISDKAEKCINCGCQINSTRYCKECGAQINPDWDFCKSCGCPVEQEYDSSDVIENPFSDTQNYPPVKKKTGKIIITIISIILVVAGSLVFFYDYRANQYYENVNLVLEEHNKGVDTFNECKELLLDVWINAILKQSNEKTDKYVCPDGVFSDDFNDALGRLFEDEEYLKKLAVMEERTVQLKALRKKLQHPPKGEEEYNELLLDYIDTDISLNVMLVNPTGSLNSVSDGFNERLQHMQDISLEMETIAD